MDVKLDWSNNVIIDNEPFPEDKLNREKYATFLTKFLVSEGFDQTRELGDRERNYVLNLNSEWGSGKTYFLKRWSDELKDNYPVIYVDAWKNDHSDDPLMTVISEIIKQLSEQCGKSEDSIAIAAPRQILGLLKAAAPGIARAMTKRFVGFDPVQILSEVENNDEALDKSDNENLDGKSNNADLSFSASDMVNYLIKEHDSKNEAIKKLKDDVYDWVKAVSGIKGKNLPAFIFIDELDRCRPSYAIEMLETIKHIFNIKGIVFVIATDTEQLQHAVKAIYGEGFDARVYLGRFFNSRFSLKEPKLNSLLEVHSDIYKLSGEYLRDLNVEIIPKNDDPKDTLRNISVVLNTFKVSARTAIQIADRIIATISNMPRGSKVDILMITVLLCIKEKDNELYEKIIKGNFKVVKDHGGGKTTTTYFDSFIEEYLNGRDGVITMNVNPKEYTDKIPGNVRANPYDLKVYNFNLQSYLKDIFSKHFKSVGNNFNLNFDVSGQNSTPLKEIGKGLMEEYYDNRLQSNKASFLWFQYIYLDGKFDIIGIDEYQDLVELASAFDWMDKENLTEAM